MNAMTFVCGVGRFAVVTLSLLAASASAVAQGPLNLGSDGSDGAFVFVQDTGPDALANTMTIDLGLAAGGLDGQGQPITWQTPSPVAGRGVYDAAAWAVVFKYSSVTVPYIKKVRFKNHPAQAPVVWLVQGTAEILGTIDVSASLYNNANVAAGATLEPGPGGFRGGSPSSLATAASQFAGFGPGGGSVPVYPPNSSNVLMGNHAGNAPGSILGSPYGSESAFPLLGGSGGPSSSGLIISSLRAGGAGGGAFLLAANSSIVLGANSQLRADGGYFYYYTGGSQAGLSGGGGTIRLVTDSLTVQGESGALPDIYARSGRGAAFITTVSDSTTGIGRIRIECNSMPVPPACVPTPSFGAIGPLFPTPTTPRVWVESVTDDTQTVPVPADPHASFAGNTVDVAVVASPTMTLAIRAANVPVGNTCQVRITKVYGGVNVYTSTPLTGSLASSSASVVVPLQETGTYSVHVRVLL